MSRQLDKYNDKTMHKFIYSMDNSNVEYACVIATEYETHF